MAVRRLIKWLFLIVPIVAVAALVVHFVYGQVPTDSSGNILKNSGFEDQSQGIPAVWNLEKKGLSKGTVAVSDKNAHSGAFSLAVSPNAKNSPWDLAHNPIGAGQGFPVGKFGGTKLYVSGWLAAEGQAAAVIDVLALGGRMPGLVELKQTSAKSGPVFREDVLMVPRDAKYLVVVCAAQGTSGTAYFDDVFVSPHVPASWDAGSGTVPAAASPGSPSALEAQVTIDAGHDLRKIPPTLFGMNIEWIWNGNGIWNPASNSLDPELIDLTRDLGVTLLRFPGGIFSDFYHWRDGIGPQASRKKTRSMPDDRDGSVHSFGTDEALAFASQTGSHLLITVNAGTGTPEEAAAWVGYVNRGGRRVDYWEVGNELYVKMGNRSFSSTTMPPEKYAQKFVEFAKAMRAVDPTIKIGAIGDENYGVNSPRAYGDWTSTVLRIAGSDMDFLAVHNGYAPLLIEDKGQSVRRVYSAMLAAPTLVRESLETASKKIAALGPERDSHIQLAVTEWGPYFQLTPADRFVDHVKTLGSALYVASALKVFIESPKMELATGFKLSDELFQGWIGKRDGHWVPKAPYYALQLYTHHFGTVLLSSNTQVAGYDSQPVGLVDALSSVPYLDVVCSRSENGRKLYIMGINKNFDVPIRAQIAVAGRPVAGGGTAWTLNGTGIDANTGTRLFQAPHVHWAQQATDETNPRFESGGPGEVSVVAKDTGRLGSKFTYTFPAHSVTALEIPLR